jgi:hypothetical protein
MSLKYFNSWLNQCLDEDKLQLEPDFQRAKVWTYEQQVKYVEFLLRGGKSNPILFNYPGWMKTFDGSEFVLVDGLQRITAITMFLDDDLSIFHQHLGKSISDTIGGYLKSQIEDIDKLLRKLTIKVYINDLPTRKEVLEWYLELNNGGTVHTKEEIEKVELLLKEELNKKPHLYLVYVLDGVINEDCYLKGSNFYATSKEDALNQFNIKSGYNLTLQQVNITRYED